MQIPPETILKNHYKILKLIGSGGYSYVYKAVDIFNDRCLAIKHSINTSREIEFQYDMEVAALNRIQEKKIPNFPVIVESFKENNNLYIILEYIEGKNLREWVETKDKLSLSVSLNIVLQVGNALRHLHRLEPYPILHRDINPSNILFRDDGTAVLIDFGLVKEDRRQETAAAAKAVTPGFAAIEQYGSGLTDVRSDIYSLGATLFFLISGKTPQESVQRVDLDNFVLMIDAMKELPQIVVDAIKKATAIKIHERHQSIDEFLVDINACWEKITVSNNVAPQAEDAQDKKTDLSETLLSRKSPPLVFNTKVSIEVINDENGYSNCIKWGKIKGLGVIYLIVKKYLSIPKNQHDGETSVVENTSFFDNNVENGIVTYYALFAVRGSSITRSAKDLSPTIRIDDVYNLQAKKAGNQEVVIDFELPKNVKQVIIKKSTSRKPVNLYDGKLAFTLETIPENEKIFKFIDKETERLPVFYTVFCRYQVRRSTLVTSKGISVLV